jgi:hypothetical protein
LYAHDERHRFRRPGGTSMDAGVRLLTLLDHHPMLRAELQTLVAKTAGLNGQGQSAGREQISN